MSFIFQCFNPEISQEWDDFVISAENGSIHQITAWKNFQERIPGRGHVLGFLARDEQGKIMATCFCVKMEMGVLGKFWWYSARGPVFLSEKAGKFLVQEITKELQKTDGIFWRFDPYVKNFNWSDMVVKSATKQFQPTDTLVIDLQKDNEKILAEMKRKGRYNINLARKKNISIVAKSGEEITDSDIHDFYRLNIETTARDKFHGHEKKYYAALLRSLSQNAVLFFALHEGKKIATAISTFCGPKAIYYFGASTSDPRHRNLMAPYLLQWEMMQYAREKNCQTYDFLGIAPEGSENHPYTGITQFKKQFGGERQTFDAGKEMALKKFWYFLYRMVKKR